ncbi:restriction endonuclease subunit S [Streptococcus suis]|uniref:restriction endonuclease subunit S n=1 Tax=Streptococcus suis TaxID=1307 RepID=UPI0024121E70|nr:restriction endonuclease subunit S [Streptococcus suis]MDG4508991.1 restriction endonuclease subunit S [Streptococcus suis]
MSEVVNLGSIFNRFSSGKTIKSSDIFEVGEYPVFGGNGIRGFCDFYNFEGECLIIGRQGANCGNVRYFSGKAYMTEHAIIGVANEYQNVGYIANKLSLMKLEQFQGQSAQPGLSVQTLSEIPIQVPEKSVQDKVFSLLSILDQKIALNNQINEELEAMAKTLYDYWFVQFDFPDENGKPYKSSGGKMVYNDQLKREIPEGWGVKRLGELAIATGKRDANFGTENGQYDFWTTANEPIKADEYSFEGKAILIAGNGNFYINFTEGKFEAYQRTYVIQSADENELLFMYPACLQSIEKLRKGSNGSIIKYITIGDVQNISQPHCPVIANMFVDIFRPIMNTIQKNKQQNQELTQLRDWLLPMLMNGQVKVEE